MALLNSLLSLVMMPISWIYACLSRILDLVRTITKWQFFPRKDVHRKRRIKSLPEEHPERISLRLRGMHAENAGLVEAKRNRTRRKRRSSKDSISQSSITDGSEYTDNEYCEEVESVSFLYWCCYVLLDLNYVLNS